MDWEDVPPELQALLTRIAEPVSQRGRVTSELMEATVLKLCERRYLGRRVLAHLLNRNPDDLLKRILNPMVASGLLRTTYPSSSDPRRAYTSNP